LKSKDQIDLGLTALDELFMDDRSRQLLHQPRIHDIPLTCIDDFPDHPFRVRMDEDMEQLVQSVRERGIITPVTLREKEDGRYELVAGHRRKRACELAGLDTIKAEIRALTRDEAVMRVIKNISV
jgi:ParB family chromosome partitioning protein